MRVKRGTLHTKRRRRILRRTRGFFHRRKSHLREARQALFKAGQYAYRDRRKKKATFRALWHVQLNAALRSLNPPLSWSAFARIARERNLGLNRKMLSLLAREHPSVFAAAVRYALQPETEGGGLSRDFKKQRLETLRPESVHDEDARRED